VTALLFALGKWLIAYYLGRSTWTSIYGAAGSLVAMLMWLYYSSLIFFFGAEVTLAIARARGDRIRPSRHAEWIDRKKAASKTGQAAPPGPAREDHEQE
jgi:membrane protein